MNSDCWWRQTLKTCTAQELDQIIMAETNGDQIFPTSSCDQVFDGIYIGDASIAANMRSLKSLNITHVLNAAFGKDLSLNLIDISVQLYSENGIKFLGIEALDIESFDLYKHFDESAHFIGQALEEKGNVLVHCKEGISRSATLVLSYLMIKKGFSAQEAVRTVRQRREIRPNTGFLLQLSYLSDRLMERKKQ